MTEYYQSRDGNHEIKCRACLTNNSITYPMTTQEVNWYQSQVTEITSQGTMFICTTCRFLLRKCLRFTQQCRKANNLLTAANENQSLSLPTLSTYTTVHYLGPLEDQSDDGNCTDDDLPLYMLTDDTERKPVKNEVTDNDHQIQEEQDIDRERETRKKDRRKKKPREGFSSRMVQETDEYVVIKLTKEQVQAEMREKLNEVKYKRSLYKCEACAKGFNFEDVLNSHMVKHTKDNGSFQCDICTQYCPSTISLRGHMKSHTTRYKCKVCGDVRLSRQHLLEHHAISHTSAAAEYTCEHCYFTTNKRTVIQRHVRSHKPHARHECDQCGRMFQNVESLRVHTTRHDKSKSLQCEYCSRRFIYPSLLQKHVQSVHVHKDYYCVECDVKFKSPDNLRLHFKKAKKHRDSSSYTEECSVCGEKFVTSSSLSVHMSTAHGHPKSYCCHVCNRMYSTRESLKGHIRRVHAERGSASHACHLCKKTFTRKSALAAHARLHSDSARDNGHDA